VNYLQVFAHQYLLLSPLYPQNDFLPLMLKEENNKKRKLDI
jgi:hypothetical protein